jgi:hypothetical protein
LPQAEALNDKRRRAIKRLLSELKEPTVELLRTIFQRSPVLQSRFISVKTTPAGVPALTTCCVPNAG